MQVRSALLLILAALPACSGTPALRPREILDDRSGNTLSVVARPLVFARERSDVAAHERDYATLVAVEIDQSGNYHDYLLLYRWSTVDPRMSAPPAADQGELRIIAEGRDIDLMPLSALPVGLGHGRELHVPAHGDVVARAYDVDATTLRYIAESHELYVRMPQEMLAAPFALREDGRGALAEFARSAGPGS
jgi:hypothetical protein